METDLTAQNPHTSQQLPRVIGEPRGWAAFQAELERFMELREESAPTLAAAIGESATTVRQWRRRTGPQRPAFEQLPLIGRALLMSDKPEDGVYDPTYLPRKMGMIPDDSANVLVQRALLLAKSRSRLDALVSRAREMTEGRLGALVNAIAASEEWAVAVWPAVEHFTTKRRGRVSEYRLYVADRLDIRRVDGRVIDEEDVWRRFSDELDFAGAFHTSATNPRWPLVEGQEASRDTWAIRHVGAPHASRIAFAYPGLPHLTVTSLSLHSWANDVAAHLARLIGYGLDSTRDLALSVYGHVPISPYGDERALFQRALLADPRPKRVWSHWSSGSDAPELIAGTGGKVRHVYLQEDEDSLTREVARIVAWSRKQQEPGLNGDQILYALTARQAEVAAYIESGVSGNVIVLDSAVRKTLDNARRMSKFERCFELAADVLQILVEDGSVDRTTIQDQWKDTEDPHLQTLIRYLRENRPQQWT